MFDFALMFRARSTEPEYFDAARPLPELTGFYQGLRRVNRLFRFALPFQRVLPGLLGRSNCASLSLLDLGAGDGFLGDVLAEWARRRHWRWNITNLDLNPLAFGFNPSGVNVLGSALALPFRDASFDVVIASQMTHHLDDAQAARHLREAWRVARRAVLISDLHRNPLLYAFLKLLFCFWQFPKGVAEDGLVSVRRGWHLADLRRLASQAGIPGARVRLYLGGRVLLQAAKPGPSGSLSASISAD